VLILFFDIFFFGNDKWLCWVHFEHISCTLLRVLTCRKDDWGSFDCFLKEFWVVVVVYDNIFCRLWDREWNYILIEEILMWIWCELGDGNGYVTCSEWIIIRRGFIAWKYRRWVLKIGIGTTLYCFGFNLVMLMVP